jgi:hypothetical protein
MVNINLKAFDDKYLGLPSCLLLGFFVFGIIYINIYVLPVELHDKPEEIN